MLRILFSLIILESLAVGAIWRESTSMFVYIVLSSSAIYIVTTKWNPNQLLRWYCIFILIAPQIKLDFPFRHPVETSIVKSTPLHLKNCLTCIICQLLTIFYSAFYSNSCKEFDKKKEQICTTELGCRERVEY